MLSKEETSCDASQITLLLEGKLEGKLEANEETNVVDHLESCPTCQEVLEQTAGDESWWDEAKANRVRRVDWWCDVTPKQYG